MKPLKTIPVVILTASQREQDIENSYALGVNTYIEKPVEFDKFLRVIRAVQNYWIVIATLSPDDTLIRV